LNGGTALVIAIVADTHGKTDSISRALALLHPAHLLFAGDHYADGMKLSKQLDIPCCAVPGNCDFDPIHNQEEIIEFLGHKIFLVHGHQYGVKRDLNNLYYRGKELEADAVVFGHTHMAYCEKIDDLWLINPGSPSRPRIPGQATYAILQVGENELNPSILKL
jgi:putative phosphoesterase